MTLPIDSEIERTRERMSDRKKIEMLRKALADVRLLIAPGLKRLSRGSIEVYGTAIIDDALAATEKE